MSEEKKKEESSYISKTIGAGFFLLLLNVIWPDLIPISSTQVWTMHGTAMEWLSMSWPIFLWGGGVSFGISFFRDLSFSERQVNAGHKFLLGLLISAFAGIVEEICFRWILFLEAIFSAMFVNWLFFGWAGFGFGEWLHLNVWGPLANWSSGGYLEGTIFHPTGFAVGAGMLYANALFRDGHKYQGPLGVLNSWFLGMYFFYLMLNYGLPAAILVHFAYDVVVFSTEALVHAWKNDL